MHENARRDARNTTLNRGGTMRAGLATEVAGHRAGHGNRHPEGGARESYRPLEQQGRPHGCVAVAVDSGGAGRVLGRLGRRGELDRGAQRAEEAGG